MATYSEFIGPDHRPFDMILDEHNQRIKLYGIKAIDMDQPLLNRLKEIKSKGKLPFTKIIIYSYQGHDELWLKLGFVFEGLIQHFYENHSNAAVWSYFIDPKRLEETRQLEHDNIIKLAQTKRESNPNCPSELDSYRASEEHSEEISVFLKQIFTDYPSSLEIDHLKHLIHTKQNHFRFLRDRDNKLVAVMSAEIDHQRFSAEMTDCATRPDYRGKGLMAYLLAQLESDLDEHYHIKDFYTLARADMVGINCVFSKLNYQYTGRLVNNCRMPNGWESMNIWCKSLS